ncbi:MAG: hypothetical protein NTW78_07525 [Campylobacterales bacterium]|nr:hypothetical protein [Campylobacterales bacterium]
MELKDVILSTLAEMEDNEVARKALEISEYEIKEIVRPNLNNINAIIKQETEIEIEVQAETRGSTPESELMYLNSIRERLLVLFEGFQAPNNTNIEAKVDMTLNFLEYVLATIDNRVENLKRGQSNESI